MDTNPLFPSSTKPDDDQSQAYVLSSKQKQISPLGEESDDKTAAANLIRQKLEQLYAEEPDAATEMAKVEAEAATDAKQSKHQRYMHELANSGKSLADIQTEWHQYYVALPDEEKHEVWREFYAHNQSLSKYHQHSQHAQDAPPADAPDHDFADPKLLAVHPAPKRKPVKKLRDVRSAKEIKQAVLDKVSAGGTLQAKHHAQSLLFGLSAGVVVLVIFLFSFFNDVFIAPFIQPSRNASATPLILSPNSVAPTATPEVIIPKINVEIPVNYTQTSTDEAAIENDLENGVVHYPTTAMPGEQGNTALFGHSSNNIFNKGKYKFAFVLLHTLVPGDTFYLTYNGKVYVYKVISRTVVDPSEVSVLGPVPGQTATATLITCDPPGTSLKRLVVVGQQVSPDPSGNTQSTTAASNNPTDVQPATLPGNGPTLWGRLWRAVF